MTDPGPKTWTTEGVRMLYELEMIDDAFCDAYQDRSHRQLGRAIDRLHEWRRQYGFEYEPFMQPTEGGAA